jgi:hypothetical protein
MLQYLKDQLKECHNTQTISLILKVSFEGYTDMHILVCFLRKKNNKKEEAQEDLGLLTSE